VTDNSSNWDLGYTYRLISVSGTSPLFLNLSGNSLTGSVSDAVANGSTKGVASFSSNDFDGTGNISIDYTNGQKATTSQTGFLTSTDWNTFNNKLSAALTSVNSMTGPSITVNSPNSSVSVTSTSNQVQLQTNFAGTGSANTSSRSDHNHDADYIQNQNASAQNASLYITSSLSGSGSGTARILNSSSSGTGIVAYGNNQTPLSPLPYSCGGALFGSTYGTYARALSTSGDRFGGFFVSSTASSTVYAKIAGYIGSTNYALYGNGTVQGGVAKAAGMTYGMSCPSSPEILFTDYGTGQLINGHAYVTLDPIFSENIFVSSDHPIKVFIQLEGECNGVFVTNKSKVGFNVTELHGGSSNVPFSYSVIANRDDLKDSSGRIISKHVGVRFSPVASDQDSK